MKGKKTFDWNISSINAFRPWLHTSVPIAKPLGEIDYITQTAHYTTAPFMHPVATNTFDGITIHAPLAYGTWRNTTSGHMSGVHTAALLYLYGSGFQGKREKNF